LQERDALLAQLNMARGMDELASMSSQQMKAELVKNERQVYTFVKASNAALLLYLLYSNLLYTYYIPTI
jgi:hypothetical protein